MASSVEQSLTLAITGTRPAASSMVASSAVSLWASLRLVNSPVVPSAHIPCTPLSMRYLVKRRVDALSTV